MVRTIIGVVVGAVCLGGIVALLQQVSSAMHPLPPELNPLDPADAAGFAEYLAGMPAGVWLVAMLSEVLGAAIGALMAGVIARDAPRGASGGVVALAVLASAANWTAFAHPVWYIAGQIFLYPVALTGVWALLAARPRSGTG